MGKLSKTNIIYFVNTKNCKVALEKKLSLNRKLANRKLGFQSSLMKGSLSAKIDVPKTSI